MEYDYIIVGAGIAGLHCALRISKAFPKATIAITEMYNYTGGRMFTFHQSNPSLAWESGAGRIHESHTHTLRYIKDYGLTLLPISEQSQWISEDTANPSKDIWPSLSDIFTTALENLHPTILATHTVEDILQSNFLTQRFPYKSELSTMRADLALKSLSETMGSSEGFYVVKEGFTSLANKMKADLTKRKVVFYYNYKLVSIDAKGGLYFKGESSMKAKKIILAIPSEALKSISQFHNLPALKHITMKPLLRTYGVFPSKAWFQGIPRTITDSPLRHIIPIDSKKGIIMTSYTDAEDTKPWLRILESKGEMALQNAIMKKMRELFPELTIPNPIFFKAHHWKHGCSYWLPGLYDVKEQSTKLMNPLPAAYPNVYVCGESYSLKQAWIEGAIEHAEEMLEKYIL
jgi:protoporphyrinogen oxidase